MQTILVVEDETTVAEGVRRTLEHEGYTVRLVDEGKSALDWLADHTPDLIIADIMMPGMNGYQFYQRVRQNPDWAWIPFVFFTARGEAEDIRYGRELGADDYLTKPIEPEDLVAAVRGRLARYAQLVESAPASQPERKPVGRYRVADLQVDLARRQVFVADEEISLTATEFDVVQRLILAEGTVVDYEDLLGYEEDETLGERDAAELLRYHIRNIRQKLKEAGGQTEPILNVRNVGYRLTETPVRSED